MKRDEITKFKLNTLISEHDKYNFATLMQKIRKVQGLNRQVICQDLNMSMTKLYFLECGHFQRVPKDEDLADLAEYHSVPFDLIKQKAMQYVEKKLNKPYSRKKEYLDE